MPYEKEFKLTMYKKMLELRVFEEAVSQMYEEGFIPNSAHLYVGQEAIAAGVCMAMRPDDVMLPSHRGHGQILAKGCDMNKMMAELFGRADGYCKGKGGSMHLAVADHNVLGSIGIVGSNMSLAAGAGMACKMNGKGQVAVCFFGDGAANRGTFHESMNIASILNLPIIYVLENNFYAISECSRDMTNIENFSCRAQGYGVPGVTEDGNNPWKVYETAKTAIERARKGEGPSLLEYVTWRHKGHYEGDPDARQWIYRSKEEHEKWLLKDPIPNTREQLLKDNTATEEELLAIEKGVNSAVEAAVQFAHASPWPDVRETYTDVYAD
jgi:TPP-dependent pyruvate/acetoin dehydrogenase alpha subunit